MSRLTMHEMQSCFCSVAAVLFTAIGISFVAIALHGSLRVPDDLFTDEVEVGNALCATFCDVSQTSPAMEWGAPAEMAPQFWVVLQLKSSCNRGRRATPRNCQCSGACSKARWAGLAHGGHVPTSQNNCFECILRHMSSHRLRQLTLWHF